MEAKENLSKRKRNKQISLLVKPTNDCQLNCQYCFDRTMRNRLRGNKLTKEQLDKLAKMCSEHAEQVDFVWHGGEPTLMGKEFYEDIQEEKTSLTIF